jgi:hypothetical protein
MARLNKMTPEERQAKAALKARCSELGCTMTVEEHGDSVRLGVEAPAGLRFSVEMHEMVDWTYKPWHPDYADMLDRLSAGVEPCDDPECEWCHPDPD